jgi:hypothetical protein
MFSFFNIFCTSISLESKTWHGFCREREREREITHSNIYARVYKFFWKKHINRICPLGRVRFFYVYNLTSVLL